MSPLLLAILEREDGSLTLSNDGCGQNLVFSDHDVEEESPKFAIVLAFPHC